MLLESGLHKAAAPAACFQTRSQGARRSPPYLSSPALTPPVLWSTCARRHLQDMYILNAAEGAGIDLPATCRGGICGRVTPWLRCPVSTGVSDRAWCCSS